MESDNDENEKVETPKKVFYELNQSADGICLFCLKYTDTKYRVRFWKTDKKLPFCYQIEAYLGIEISRYDFKILCRNCQRSISIEINKRSTRISQLKESREEVKKHLTTRVKRLSKSNNTSETTRKRLGFEEDVGFDRLCHHACETKITTRNENGSVEEITVPPKKKKLIHLILKDDMSKAVHHIIEKRSKTVEDVLLRYLKTSISNDTKFICSSKQSNSFMLNGNPKSLESFKYDDLYSELQNKTPFLITCIESIAVNPRLKRNKNKNFDFIKSAMMNSVGSLLMCRNQNMNKIAALNSLVLRHGKADKQCFHRLNHLQQTVSYKHMLKIQEGLGEGYGQEVKDWSAALTQKRERVIDTVKGTECDIQIIVDTEENSRMRSIDHSFFDPHATESKHNYLSETEEEIISESDSECDPGLIALKSPVLKKASSPPAVQDACEISPAKFMLVGDNLDMKVKRRHMTIDRQNADWHLFNSIAVKNRVEAPTEIFDLKAPNFQAKDVDIEKFLPTKEDDLQLRNEFKVLVARDLFKYIHDLDWMKKYIQSELPHRHSEEMKEKSEIASLGITKENENTTEGIIDIMHELRKLVPGNETDALVRLFSVGDLLTVEREQNAQEDLRDSPTTSERLEGLIPALADFHTYGNFLELIWSCLYDVRSSSDNGTLFFARNFLNARNVPGKPMKDINACEDLLEKYSDSLILTAYNHFINKQKPNLLMCDDEEYNKNAANKLVLAIVDNYVMVDTQLNDETHKYVCKCCSKEFVLKANLLRHKKTKCKPSSADKSTTEDSIHSYSQNALMLSYLVKDFVDARKHGDGERIIRLYKYFLLYFKAFGRTKYAFQSLHLLAQIHYLLPPALAYELKWNRFANNKGGNNNIELDRCLEHRNRYAKEELKALRGKLCDKSIDRVSRSYDSIRKVINSCDDQCKVKKPYGRHSKPNWENDVKDLATRFGEADLFSKVSGREFKQYPSFPKSLANVGKKKDYKEWIGKKMVQFKRMNIYTNTSCYTFNV